MFVFEINKETGLVMVTEGRSRGELDKFHAGVTGAAGAERSPGRARESRSLVKMTNSYVRGGCRKVAT